MKMEPSKPKRTSGAWKIFLPFLQVFIFFTVLLNTAADQATPPTMVITAAMAEETVFFVASVLMDIVRHCIQIHAERTRDVMIAGFGWRL